MKVFYVYGVKVEMSRSGSLIKICTTDPELSDSIYKYLGEEGFLRLKI